MRYFALATDYDGTLAHHGQVSSETLDALERLKNSGRRLIMVTGRELEDLFRVFPEYPIFDRIVAENGALLYCPQSRSERSLGESPPQALIEGLRARGVEDLSVGRVILATWIPHETTALEVIRDLGLEHQVIFNKGAVMILPGGVNKATGLGEALRDLGLSPHNTVGVGDAENDHAFLKICECSVAVANALPAIKDRVCLVTQKPHGEGVTELIERLLARDLEEIDESLPGRAVVIGRRSDGGEIRLHPNRESVLVTGASGAGKSTFTTGFMERLAAACYQFCIIDPEGDYEGFEQIVSLGDARHTPVTDEVLMLMQKPEENAGINLVGLPLEERPAFFESLFLRLKELRARTGRPHWTIIDETQHLMPRGRDSATLILPQELKGAMMITLTPSHVAQAVLTAVDVVVGIGQGAEEVIRDFAQALRRPAPPLDFEPAGRGEGIIWFRHEESAPFKFKIIPPQAQLKRHVRKYIDGQMEEVSHFFFRGPEGKLNLRAQNLTIFLQLSDGVDDATWEYHLRRGDLSRWFREAVKDEELAEEAVAIERNGELSPAESRARIREIIEKRYTAP